MNIQQIIHHNLNNIDRFDLEVLLAHVLNISRATLKAYPERTLSPTEQRYLENLLIQRALGMPIAYLLGYKDFWKHTFTLTTAVLIPRPETELLVELALKAIHEQNITRVLDLGTGSGAVGLSIAAECQDVKVILTDLSNSALAVAMKNAQNFKLNNVAFFLGDWFNALPTAKDKFELIVSNPPYIEELDPHLHQGDLRFEPKSALVAAADGMRDIRTIIANAPSYLQPGGQVMLEHGYNQAEMVRNEFIQHGYVNVASHADLAGIERVTSASFIK